MKKISKILFALAALMLLAMPAFAASSWDEIVEQYQKNEAVTVRGEEIVKSFAANTERKDEIKHWKNLSSPDAKVRLDSAMALVRSMFPNEDPANWDQVGGFIKGDFRRPRQLAAMDAFFVAVRELAANGDTIWAAAYLLNKFRASGLGMVTFIEDMPKEMTKVIAYVVEQTGLQGDWKTTRVRGKIPMLPFFDGQRSRSTVENLQMVYLDGIGRIAANGSYAWDRDRGYIYEIMEEASPGGLLFK